jgi:hypothetical protein
MFDAAYWIQKLNLLPHPEGGFYKETYRSNETSIFQLGELQKNQIKLHCYLLLNRKRQLFSLS